MRSDVAATVLMLLHHFHEGVLLERVVPHLNRAQDVDVCATKTEGTLHGLAGRLPHYEVREHEADPKPNRRLPHARNAYLGQARRVARHNT